MTAFGFYVKRRKQYLFTYIRWSQVLNVKADRQWIPTSFYFPIYLKI